MFLIVSEGLELTVTQRTTVEKENGILTLGIGLSVTTGIRRKDHSLAVAVIHVYVVGDRLVADSLVTTFSVARVHGRTLLTRRYFTTSKGRVYFNQVVFITRKRVIVGRTIAEVAGLVLVTVLVYNVTKGISVHEV